MVSGLELQRRSRKRNPGEAPTITRLGRAPTGSLDAPKLSRTIERRSDPTPGRHGTDGNPNPARVDLIEFAPSSGRIGACERNRRNYSGTSGLVCRASTDRTRNAKSFKVPRRLRFLVRPNAISDIRGRSLATFPAATPTMASISHTATGNAAPSRFASRIGMTTGSWERSPIRSSCWRSEGISN